MNILSLFDGMSCGQLALNKLGINKYNYFASEIDESAIKITMKNFPNTTQLGDVKNINGYNLPKIDLLIGGSPCQGFSFAGKQLNFEDERSALFFEYVRILKELKEVNPNIKFLLENVRMKKEFQQVISDYLSVNPIAINSRLVSAQNRYRLYWTNIEGVNQPNDLGIYLSDILEDKVDKKYFLSEKALSNVRYHTKNSIKNLKYGHDKSACLSATTYKGFGNDGCTIVLGAAQRGKYLVEGAPAVQIIEVNETGKSNCISTVTKDSLLLTVPEATKKGFIEVQDEECFDNTFPKSKTRRGRLMVEKSNCLTATKYDFMLFKDNNIRRLTPLECERLQTVPDNYTDGVSNSARYKMLGNGWTIDIISHILSFQKWD